MLEDKQNIDNIFSDALRNYKEEAPAYSWKNIQESLASVRKARKLSIIRNIALFFALILTFTLGYWASNYDLYEKSGALYMRTPSNNPIESHKLCAADSINFVVEDVVKQANIKADEQFISIENAKNNCQSKVIDEYYKKETVNISQEQTETKQNKTSNKKHNQLLTNVLLWKEECRQRGGSLLSDHHKIVSNWSFGAKFSPIYLINNICEALPEKSIDNYEGYNGNNLNTVSSKILSAYTGGINVNYRLSKRLSIESGIFYSTRKKLSTLHGISHYENEIDNTNSFEDVNTPYPNVESQNEHTSAGYTQNIDYLELPFSVKYRVIDRKFGLDFAGGMSTNFLIRNDVYGKIENYSLSNYANSVLYNANISIGLNYRFWERVQFNLEPTVKYSLYPSSHSLINVYPYSFAVFAGFIYNLK